MALLHNRVFFFPARVKIFPTGILKRSQEISTKALIIEQILHLKQAGTCISCEDLSVYKSDKKSNKNKVNNILL